MLLPLTLRTRNYAYGITHVIVGILDVSWLIRMPNLFGQKDLWNLFFLHFLRQVFFSFLVRLNTVLWGCLLAGITQKKEDINENQ